MNERRDPDAIVRSWLREDVADPADPMAVRGRVLERLPDVRRRRRWWSLHRPRSRDVRPGKGPLIMFTAVRVAALTAIVALGGVFALVISTGAPAPSTPDASAPTDAAYVTGEDGSAVLSWRYLTTTEGDITHLREGVVTLTSEMSDPRASGTITFAFSVDAFPGDAGLEWGTMHIENDGGAWTGPCAGGAKPDGDPFAASCWLTGSGDYEGYTYFRQHVWGGNLAERALTEGLIFPGVPPTEYPDLPPASE